MLARAIGQGLLTPFRRPGLVLLLWAWGLLLVLAPAAAFARWFGSALGSTMAGDSLLQRIDLAVLSEVGQYDRTPVASVVTATLAGALLVGALVGPLVAGGTLEVLTAGDRRSLMHRFFRGAGHFYWRYLRLYVMAAGATGLLLLGVTLVVSPVVAVVSSSSWEPAGPLATAALLALLALVVVVGWLSLDYARIRVATEDSHVMWRALIGGAGFVLRRLAGTFVIALVFGGAFLLLLALYLIWTASASFAGAWAIALLFFVQQAALVVRHGLRVGQVDAELGYWRARKPAEPATVQPPVATPGVGPEAAPPAPAGQEPSPASPESEEQAPPTSADGACRDAPLGANPGPRPDSGCDCRLSSTLSE